MANDKISSSNLPILWNRIVSLFVAKESGKGLSSNDFTNTYKTKLDGIQTETKLDQVVEAGATSVTFTNAAIKDGVSIRLQSDILGVNYDYTNPPQFTNGKLVVSFPPQTKDMTVRLIVK